MNGFLKKNKGARRSLFEKIKDKFFRIISSRAVALSGVLVIFACILICRIFSLQIVNGEEYQETAIQKQNKDKVIAATRGRILDRNGQLLAHDEPANSVTIEDVYDSGSKKNEQVNETLVKTIKLIEKCGDNVDLDGFGITRDIFSGRYMFSAESDTKRKRFLADVYGYSNPKDLSEEEKHKTPSQVVDDLCYEFGIGEYKADKKTKDSFEPRAGYSEDLAFKLLVIRYRMKTNGYQKYISISISSNVNDKTVAAVMENMNDLKGVSVEMNTMRIYEDPECFSGILGYTGKATTDDLEKLKQQGAVISTNNKSVIIGAEGYMAAKNVDFSGGLSGIKVNAFAESSNSSIDVYLDKMGGEPIASINITSRDKFAENGAKLNLDITGRHAVYFVAKGNTVTIDSWEATALSNEKKVSGSKAVYPYDKVEAEDSAEFKVPDYNMNDTVGKFGIELSMESVLHGTKGKESVTVDNTGKVIKVNDVKEPVAGKDVYLTIDKDLTIACYNIIEKRLASIITDKLTTGPTNPNAKPANSSEIKISIYDVYFALFNNNVIDISHFSEPDAKKHEKVVKDTFEQKKNTVIATIKDELFNKKTPYNKLSTEYSDYMDHIISKLYDENIIVPDKKSDLYKRWTKGDMALSDYIYEALSEEWIDVSKLALEDQYVDSDDTFKAIVEYILVGKESEGDDGTLKKYGLYDDHEFDTSLFRYMINSGNITGVQICNILLEQEIVKSDDIDGEELKAWSSGGGNPFEFIKNRINNLDITPAQLAIYPSTASMVVTDINTGDVLALVSYPGYDNNRMANGANSEYFAKLNNDKSRPMLNYATQEKTVPGSTFKPLAATAGLMEGVITTTSDIHCSGVFTKLGGNRSPTCWRSGGHGSLNVVGGIRNSCNCFFYEVGYRLGFNKETNRYDSNLGCEKLKKYADMYGLTEKSGVEIEEHTPEVAQNDAVRGAIGQDTNNYTTVGLARYVTAIANSGTCFNLTLIDKTKDSNGNIEEHKTSVRNKIEMNDAYWNNIHTGMRQVVMDKAYYSKLNNAGIPVAGKTGTAQTSDKTPNHSLFIGYAPYDDPQIAVATRIDYGYTSSYAAQFTKDVLEYYFKITKLEDILSGGEHLQDGSAVED